MILNLFFSNSLINEIPGNKIFGVSDSNIAKEILQPDTLKYSQSEIIFHNKSISDFLTELITNDQNSVISREESKMQMRLFYVAILSALISFLLNKKYNLNKKIIIVLIFIILSMYGLEIHNYDMLKRGQASLEVKVIATNTLLNEDSSSVKYNLNLEPLISKMKDSSNSLTRKIKTALIIDVERFIFYILPLMLLIGYDIFQSLKPQSNNEF